MTWRCHSLFHFLCLLFAFDKSEIFQARFLLLFFDANGFLKRNTDRQQVDSMGTLYQLGGVH